MNSFYLEHRPLVVDTTKYRRHGRFRGVTKRPSKFQIPIFEFFDLPYTNNEYHNGASYVFWQFSGAFSRAFHIQMPLQDIPAMPNFVPCIRWHTGTLAQNNIVVHRYKLWEDVGEDLDYPLYSGQLIPSNFVLELWTTMTSTTVSNSVALDILTSLLNIPTDCCDNDNPLLSITNLAVWGQFPLCRGGVITFDGLLTDWFTVGGIGWMQIGTTFIVGGGDGSGGDGGRPAKVCPVVESNNIIDEFDNPIVTETGDNLIEEHT